ncbi:MAG: hypothetical protein HY696_08845 [Deltaproteobacteria bacterium]|nr:hypothetical protein [Deltaproteobacteria bacterium]
MRRFTIGLIALGLALTIRPAFAAWQSNATAPSQTDTLNKVEQLVGTTKNAVVLLDLDSTLYDNRGRSAAIIQEYGQTKSYTALQIITGDTITDGFQVTEFVLAQLKNTPGIDAAAVGTEFSAFWAQRFFGADYLKYDRPLPGAVEFVKGLYGKGASLLYVSSRDEQTLRTGTEAKMRADGFPLGDTRAILLMKPANNVALSGDKNSPAYKEAMAKANQAFKQSIIEKARAIGTVVASFENEPGQINQYFENLHKTGTGVAVFLDTDHFPNAPAVSPGVQAVRGFLR